MADWIFASAILTSDFADKENYDAHCRNLNKTKQ